ncbi:MAG: PilT/PilU family type 4a pilus ATPase [Phycisphaerae bacterium]|nr:PilT/PilU family type 4a pilus ATPase [Phycisphaerae bacterium]
MGEMNLSTNSVNGNGKGASEKLMAFFRAVIKHDGSDLHLKANSKPRMRIGGSIRTVAGEELSNADIEEMIFSVMSPKLREMYQKNGAVDFAYDLEGEDRFRLNVFRQRGMTSIAARRVERDIPTFEGLNLPAQIGKLASYHQGLVLLSGITGSGKSTTIAAMLEYINENRACHIVTIEDPIEYIFTDKKAFINQREVGIDVADFSDGLKYLMREDPDVVLIGEMRDRQTFQAALQAAETGHLVLGTIHSSSTAQTVTRLLDLFPQEERSLIRQSLVFNLKAIISQRLLPSIKEGTDMIPAVEILINNPAIRKLIGESRESDILDVIKSNYDIGMQDFNESLRQMVAKEWIESQTAYDASPNPEELKMRLKGINASKSGIL